MEKRVLRSRAGKEIEKENILPQPAKRVRRAISTIEFGTQMNSAAAKKATASAAKMVAAAAKTAKKAKPGTFSDVSTQTVDDSLVSTIRMITGELIAKTNLLHQKDQKYIEMMEHYYLEREKLRAENGAKDLQIAQLNERINTFQNIPLVPIEIDGKMISRRIITKMTSLHFFPVDERNPNNLQEGDDGNLMQFENEIEDLLM